MSSNATLLLARRSMRARIGRLIAIAIAIILGVAFVVGSFVLADSMRSGFDTLFSDAFGNTDLQVRTELAFGDSTSDGGQDTRDPVPAELVDTVAAVPGVADADGMLQRTAQIIDSDGEAITTGGAPMFGASWDSTDPDNSIRLLDGDAPAGAEQMAIDGNTADHNDLEVGDQIDVVTTTGRHSFTLSGTVGLGNSDGFGGATFALWDPATAASVLGAEGDFRCHRHPCRRRRGRRRGAATRRHRRCRTTSRSSIKQTLLDESNDNVNQFIGPLGTGLLIFAFITAFVSAFLINNVFAITIGQRLRELALLRAVGGAGRQVRRLIVMEALVMSVIATIIGIFAGIGVAKLILAIFNAAGSGFPNFGIVLKPTAVVMAFLVGVGITVLAVLLPARRASRIPPVAAMRPELGFDALSTKRLVGGTVTTIVGAAMFLVGLLARPGGTPGLIALAGGGALLLFLGTASVSSTVAKPVTKLIGWPVAKVYKAPGQLASENAGSAPRRTSATVAALMIGVALVSASAVFAASLRNTFEKAMNRGVTADWVVTAGGFALLPDVVSETLADVPELSAVSGVRSASVRINGDEKLFGAGDPVALEQLIDVGLESGDWEGLEEGGIFVHQDPAADLDLEVGSIVEATFQNGEVREMPVAGIYSDAYLVGNWLMSSTVLSETVCRRTERLLRRPEDCRRRERGRGPRRDRRRPGGVPTGEDRDRRSVQGLAGGTDRPAARDHHGAARVRHHHRRAGDLDHPRSGGVRADPRDRPDARRRHDEATDPPDGSLGGGHRVDVRCHRRHRPRHADRHRPRLRRARHDHRRHLVLDKSTIIYILIGAVLAGFIAALYPSIKASRMDILEAIATE